MADSQHKTMNELQNAHDISHQVLHNGNSMDHSGKRLRAEGAATPAFGEETKSAVFWCCER